MEEGEAKKAKKQWVWHPNIYDLKTATVDSTQIWNCSPYVMICSFLNSEEDPEVVVNIEMDKEFKWSPDVGWIWHKTWNIPTISLGMTMVDKNTMQELECPMNIEVNLYAAKLVTNQANMIYFSSIPLKGETSYKLVDGRVTIEGVKFDTTSYNHNVRAFKLREANST
jgi:hypothetical protein